jgi:hypothetical protein
VGPDAPEAEGVDFMELLDGIDADDAPVDTSTVDFMEIVGADGVSPVDASATPKPAVSTALDSPPQVGRWRPAD